jgi:hypothetical protein
MGIFKKKKIIYSANFGDYDLKRSSADITCNEENNPFDGSSAHLSPRLMAKLYKVLNPLKYDIWIDSSVDILDRKGFERLFTGDLCVFKHPFNKTVSDELKSCKQAGFVNNKQIENIKNLYNKSKLNIYEVPMYACTMLYRTLKADEFNRLWWQLICEYSYRDQLTFPYALSRFPDLDFRTIDINIYNMDGIVNPYFYINQHK